MLPYLNVSFLYNSSSFYCPSPRALGRKYIRIHIPRSGRIHLPVEQKEIKLRTFLPVTSHLGRTVSALVIGKDQESSCYPCQIRLAHCPLLKYVSYQQKLTLFKKICRILSEVVQQTTKEQPTGPLFLSIWEI